MSRSRKSWAGAGLAVAAAGCVTAGLVPGTAQAQGAPSLQVIASKLNNPRGVTVLGDGTILVAESGTGGKGPCVGSGQARQCFGTTGSIYRVKGAQKGRVVRGLPSVSEGGGAAAGPVDVAVYGKDYVVLNNAGGSVADRARFGANARRMGTLYRVRGGVVYGDLVSHETRLDPDWVLPRTDPGEPSVNANPWRFAAGTGGQYVTDAGGNDLVRVADGKTYTEAIFPHGSVAPIPKATANSAQARRLLQVVAGTRAPEQGIPVQSVPTGIVKGPDGALYVSELGGFAPKASRIWRIAPGQRPRVFATGLTAVSDLTLDGRGNLVALTMTTGFGNGPNDPPLPGAIYKINLRTKKRTEVPTGGKLFFPTGVAVGKGGEIYVANNGVGNGAGQLVRVRV